MENKHIELLAKEILDIVNYAYRTQGYYPLQQAKETILKALVKALPPALQALETALTEKHRAELSTLRGYAKHRDDCDLNTFMSSRTCTCGLDQLLTTNPKE